MYTDRNEEKSDNMQIVEIQLSVSSNKIYINQTYPADDTN